MILSNRKYRGSWGYFALLGLLALLAAGMYQVPTSTDYSETHPSLFATHVHLRIARDHLFQIRLKRDEAIKKQILVTDEEDWVRGWLSTEQGEIPVDLRLKGDWTDHLQEEKWSFRVKCEQGGAFKGMRVFSLQSPKTRAFLSEWALHQFAREQGLLTSHYDFVRLHINGSDIGAYALESHFSKELLESQGRREGPMVKFEEAGLWETRVREFQTGAELASTIAVFQGSHSLPFQVNKLLEDSVLAPQWEIANNLMFQYKEDRVPFGNLFDLEAMGKRQAVIDLFGAHHSLYWSNTRFYFNPILQKLEPIIYDGFAEPNPEPLIKELILGYGMNANTTFEDPSEKLGTHLFTESVFLEAYYGALLEYCQKLPAWLDDLNPEVCSRANWIGKEYLLYTQDFKEIRRKTVAIPELFGQFDPATHISEEWVNDSTLHLQNTFPLAVKFEWTASNGKSTLHYLEAKDEHQEPQIYPFIGPGQTVNMSLPGCETQYEVQLAPTIPLAPVL